MDRDYEGKTAIHVAIACGNIKIVNLILDAWQAQSQKTENTALASALSELNLFIFFHNSIMAFQSRRVAFIAMN